MRHDKIILFNEMNMRQIAAELIVFVEYDSCCVKWLIT